MSGKVYEMRLPRAGWHALRWRFACRETTGPYPGIVSLTVLDELERPFFAGPPACQKRVVDSGFFWIQLAPERERWWLTAMFDENRRLVQFYFDITFGNILRPGGASLCPDAFVDVILEPDGEPRIVDLDELGAACRSGDITPARYARAAADAAETASRFRGRAGELEVLSRGWLEDLLPRL